MNKSIWNIIKASICAFALVAIVTTTACADEWNENDINGILMLQAAKISLSLPYPVEDGEIVGFDFDRDSKTLTITTEVNKEAYESFKKHPKMAEAHIDSDQFKKHREKCRNDFERRKIIKMGYRYRYLYKHGDEILHDKSYPEKGHPCFW